jgi:hypothetical protein
VARDAREAIAEARIAQIKSGRYWPIEQLPLFPLTKREVVDGLKADRPRRKRRR